MISVKHFTFIFLLFFNKCWFLLGYFPFRNDFHLLSLIINGSNITLIHFFSLRRLNAKTFACARVLLWKGWHSPPGPPPRCAPLSFGMERFEETFPVKHPLVQRATHARLFRSPLSLLDYWRSELHNNSWPFSSRRLKEQWAVTRTADKQSLCKPPWRSIISRFSLHNTHWTRRLLFFTHSRLRKCERIGNAGSRVQVFSRRDPRNLTPQAVHMG